MMKTLDVVSVAGARPNFMKIAPLARALGSRSGVRHRLVHTGQHYDKNMSDLFFQELGIPAPWKNLEVGSGTHGRQTGEIMIRFEEALGSDRPDLVVVVGDVNSTIACALVAVKLGIPVAHVEAGLRSGDRSMPEEINRILTDAISDSLFVTERAGMENLTREGVPADRLFLVGNVMIDTLLQFRDQARSRGVLGRIGQTSKGFGLVTLHRPSNVDDPEKLRGILGALRTVSERLPLVFPVHPRTKSRLLDAGFDPERDRGFHPCEPLGYVDFLGLMEGARIILTDSGGIQEEACVLGTPCLTMRENTERPVTVEVGMNKLVGTDPAMIEREALAIIGGDAAPHRVPDLWDGRAAERIADIVVRRYGRLE